jgi:hypothetical protein
MGIESHALDRFDDSEHALAADTGTVHLGHYGISVAGVLEFMKTLSIEVERAYSHSGLVCLTRWARFVRPSAGVETTVRLSNQALEATATVPGRVAGDVPGSVTPAACAAVAPSLPVGDVYTSCRVAVPQLGR